MKTIDAVVASSAMLRGALEAMSEQATQAHLAGRGLVLTAEWVGDLDLPRAVDDLRALVIGLSGTVRGLAPGETVTLAWLAKQGYGHPWCQVLVEMRPEELESLTVHVDGRAVGETDRLAWATSDEGSDRPATEVELSPSAVTLSSARLLYGAVEGISYRTKLEYVCGEGLRIGGTWLGAFDLDQVQRDVAALLTGMGGTVKGLQPGESITIEWVGRHSGENHQHHVIARMAPGDEASLEVDVRTEVWGNA